MTTIQTSIPGLTLALPDVERDAPFALAWFESAYGRETLLLMGNAEHDIKQPTLEGEKETIRSFITLREANKQLTWAIRSGTTTIGAVWIELVDTQYVQAPALHIMIGDKDYRGKGIGTSVMRAMIEWAERNLKEPALYSRHLVANKVVAAMNKSLGFKPDGDRYTDAEGLEWQNIQLVLKREQV